MKFLYLVFCTLLFIQCVNDKKKSDREYTSVEIGHFTIDSTSIRALAPIDEHRVWFAGNLGRVGMVDNNILKIDAISYSDSLLEFRAIAATQEAIFVLSVASPAVLYKIGYDGIQATSVEQVYFEEGEKVFYNAIKFWNNLQGIAMGDPVEKCLSIILTNDGGKSWKKIPCDQLPELEEGEAGYAASNSNIALYGDKAWIATGGKKSRVFISEDKGDSWNVFDTPITSGGKMTGIYSIDFYDDKLGFVIGGDWENKEINTSNKAFSDTGGQEWKLVSDGKNPGYSSSVKFVPNGQGNELVAVGSSGISYSNNRGETWSELSQESLFAIEFINDSIAFASGNNKIVKLTFKE